MALNQFNVFIKRTFVIGVTVLALMFIDNAIMYSALAFALYALVNYRISHLRHTVLITLILVSFVAGEHIDAIFYAYSLYFVASVLFKLSRFTELSQYQNLLK